MPEMPTADDINRLEKAAWDAHADQVLVWERDRVVLLLAALDALVVHLHRDANAIDADGDICCGQTRRSDANLIAITIGPYRTE